MTGRMGVTESDSQIEGPGMAPRRTVRSRLLAWAWSRTWARRAIKVAAVLVILPIVLTIIAPVLAHSVIMSEDGQFCSHRGVDLAELKLVIDDAIAGEQPRGASTITMQTVKNLYLWSRPFGTLRKVVELPLAVYTDLVLPKRRIMEIYLNIAEWGPNVYGIEAAAQYHFGRSAKNLTRRQAALLTVALPNPIGRNPARPGPGLRRLANLIEARAARAGGYIGCLE
jgi:monofunctional biosynthetic peptidoglycan transglycosylase